VIARLTPLRREIRGHNNRWYDIRLRPYRTIDDKIDGVVITFVDITERRQVEEALRESERQLRQQKSLIELSREPIFIWDFDCGIVEWNHGCEELYGFSHEEALGQLKDNLLSTSGADFSFADVRAKLLADGSWSGELTQRTKDGRLLTVESSIQLESVDGQQLVLESIRDITERKSWEKRQQLLLAELSHRVKNTLAVVQSIAHQTQRAGGSSDDFVRALDGRLAALASAHDLLVETEWRGADLTALAQHQLEPYAVDDPERVTIRGEPVSLPAHLATPFSLVLHELATNVAKYGSLSQPKGKVLLSWDLSSRNNPPVLRVQWQEENGPSAAPSRPTGFGTGLIEQGIPRATVRREFGSEGLLCTIEVPLSEAEDNGRGSEA
jgi:two-component system, chemotaxis family, CheB/CheR fusion protein